MKTRMLPGPFLTLTIAAALSLAAGTVPAQDAATAPVQLSYGVSQIIQLSKANVGEDTVLTFVRNSGNNYGLNADQIVYLKQQGVSAAVINAMLTQRQQTAQTAPQLEAANTAVTQPAVTYVQPAPAYVPSSTVYVIPDTQTYNYYAYSYRPYGGCYYPYYGGYGCYPSVSFSVGFGGGHWGGYYRGGWGGGYRGGYRGGGGWHR